MFACFWGACFVSAAALSRLPPANFPGRALALLEMRMALAAVYASVEIEAVRPSEVTERYAFNMCPEHLQVRLRRRPDPASTVTLR